MLHFYEHVCAYTLESGSVNSHMFGEENIWIEDAYLDTLDALQLVLLNGR